MIKTRVELIISSSTVLSSTLNNYNNKFEDIDSSTITLPSKIDLLIIDDYDNFKSLNIKLYKIRTIINLTQNHVHQDEILIEKPFYLSNLLNLINLLKKNEEIFYYLNHHNLIYNESAKHLINQKIKITLTDKENKVFKYLLLANGNWVSSDELLSKVWFYHEDSNSTAPQAIIQYLKQKLPKDLLESMGNNYKLNL